MVAIDVCVVGWLVLLFTPYLFHISCPHTLSFSSCFLYPFLLLWKSCSVSCFFIHQFTSIKCPNLKVFHFTTHFYTKHLVTNRTCYLHIILMNSFPSYSIGFLLEKKQLKRQQDFEGGWWWILKLTKSPLQSVFFHFSCDFRYVGFRSLNYTKRETHNFQMLFPQQVLSWWLTINSRNHRRIKSNSTLFSFFFCLFFSLQCNLTKW